jgi:large subunit ribosomal protein L21
MYAVIRSGGKQYRVEPGQTIEVERLEGKVGGTVTFENVVSVRTDETKFLGGENASKAKVTGKILRHLRGPKLKTLKYKTGGQYQIQRGHRQGYTAVQVGDIQLS